MNLIHAAYFNFMVVSSYVASRIYTKMILWKRPQWTRAELRAKVYQLQESRLDYIGILNYDFAHPGTLSSLQRTLLHKTVEEIDKSIKNWEAKFMEMGYER